MCSRLAKSGEQSYCWVLHVLKYPQATPLVAPELCASQVLRQACGKGQLPPQGQFTKGGKPEGPLDGLAL